ncbi:MAG: hypothetical protein FWE76_00865 [Symbiobacteriaceae bacterium]|nr:hypothetical protein [Symbiobacteriaceae bacterium]
MRVMEVPMQDWGVILVTRRMGENIRMQIAARLSAEQEPLTMLLDFQEVEIMDYSCADELVTRLAVEINNRLYGDRFLLLANMNEALCENVFVALKQRGIAMQHLPIAGAEEAQLIGELRPYLESALAMLNKSRILTARDLADAEGLAINTASNRLTELAKGGLAHRRSESVASGGKQYQYLSILPAEMIS